MGRSCPLTTEDEVNSTFHKVQLMRKVCHLFDSTREKLIREQQLPDFSFEDFVEAWDENDKFIKRLFEFFIKETAMRHFMKKTTNGDPAQSSNNSYGNLVDLALNVASTPRTSNLQASNIQRILQNTIQEDQAARHAWMVSGRNMGNARDRRRFRPQNGPAPVLSRPMPQDEAATTRIYRTSSVSADTRSIPNSHVALIDNAILDLLPIPAGVVSVTHGLPLRRPNRNLLSTETDFVRPGQVEFSQIEVSQPNHPMNLDMSTDREI